MIKTPTATIEVSAVAPIGATSPAVVLYSALCAESDTFLTYMLQEHERQEFESAALSLERYEQVEEMKKNLVQSLAKLCQELNGELSLLKSPTLHRDTQAAEKDWARVGRLNHFFEKVKSAPMPDDWDKDEVASETTVTPNFVHNSKGEGKDQDTAESTQQ
ncbi:hypothetical protein GCM10027347_61210 [Larkinella harenae]